MIEKYAADMFKILYRQTGMCVLVVDGDRVVRQCNAAICSILDRREESVVGQKIDVLSPLPIDEARYEGVQLQLDRDGCTCLMRQVFTKRDGTPVQFMGRVFRVDANVHFFILFPDQETEQIYEVAKLRRNNDELVKLVLHLKQQVERQRNRKAFPANVTSAERKIAAMVAKGKTTEEIARDAHRSIATVKNHRKSLRKKLNLEQGYSLSAALREYGLL